MRIKKALFAAVLCSLTIGRTFGQFSDDFSDGDLLINPTWQGDVAQFVTNAAGQLQLAAPDAGTSKIFTAIELKDSVQWEFYLKLDFDPSTSNRLRIFLQADTSDFSISDGYFLEIGETGSEDAVRFFRSDEGNATLLASGRLAAVATTPAVARLRIKRSTDGRWQVDADYDGNRNFMPEASFSDATYPAGKGFFGIECTYTSTRKDKFFFDDIAMQSLASDQAAPRLLSAKAVAPSVLEVNFDEPLEASSATAPDNYSVDGGIGKPTGVQLVTPVSVRLTFAQTFENQRIYTLQMDKIADTKGNISGIQTATFSFLNIESAAPFDILINEIMADPTPSNGLPEAEYIELYNRSDKIIALKNLGLDDNGSFRQFPDSMLFPGEYAVVVDDDFTDNFKPFGKIIPLPTFPVLTNTGEFVTLRTTSGELINGVNFSDDWYGDAGKKAGGWSLELINPLQPCGIGFTNWSASQHLSGGTPGRANSILDAQPDETFPDLLTAFPNTPTEISLFFSEGMDIETGRDIANYNIEPALSIQQAVVNVPFIREIKLSLAEPMQEGVVYEIRVGQGVEDCAGNGVGLKDRIKVALPQKIEPNDLVVNEVLFNPATEGFDFVEIFNRSGKTVNLADLNLASITADRTEVIPVDENFLLFPSEYAVFTESPLDIFRRYPVQNPTHLIENPLPSLPDAAGNFTLLVPDIFAPVQVDKLDYDEDWHHPLLDDKNGVSLERLSTNAPTQEANNWHSASANAGYATPTYRNSQAILDTTTFEDLFFIEKATFSPDGDDFEDFLIINYQTDQPGYIATVRIFDAAGRLVKNLSRSELFGTEGFLRWDGDTDNGEKAGIGIYVILIEMFLPTGEIKEFKKTCVVAAKLD